MATLIPKLNVLPDSQRLLWARLGSTPKDFVLYGGTALALRLGHREIPDRSADNGIAVASLLDIFGMKCATVSQRNETKDYLDIHALMTAGGIALAEGLGSAGAIYGTSYNPILTLQALSYFDDLPEPLSEGVRTDIIAAVKSVSLQKLPKISASREIGGS